MAAEPPPLQPAPPPPPRPARPPNRQLENTGRVKPENKVARRLVAHSAAYAGRSQERLAEAGESRAARLNPLTRRWQIAPVCDGRITRVGGDA